MITRNQIKAFAPSARADLSAAIVDLWHLAEGAGITRAPARMHGFMATIAVETGGLRSVEESLNYTPEALISNFSRERISEADARKYGRTKGHPADQQAIANLIYGGPWGKKNLGNTEPGDGWRYRGGGMGQTTGRANYRKLGFEDNPEDLRDPVIAFATAVQEWTKRGCNAIADGGNLKALRIKWNGGTNGYADFIEYHAKAARVWPKASPPAEPAPAAATDTVTVEAAPDASAEPRADTLRIQTQLRALGYTEVGTPDGKTGPMTEAAILAFRNENGLPLKVEVDDAFLAALAKASPRQVASERVEMKSAQVASIVPEAKASWWSRAWGYILAVPAGVGTAVTGIMDGIPGAKEFLDPLKEFASDVPTWVWFAAVVIVAAIIIRLGNSGVKHSTEAFQVGARR